MLNFRITRGPAALLALGLTVSGFAQAPAVKTEKLFYEADWRLMRAGVATVTWNGVRQSELRLETAGLVAKLLTVQNTYRANYDPGYCVTGATLDAQEGSRHRDTKVTFDRAKKKSTYLERDLRKNITVRQSVIDTPPCVRDVLGALETIRQRRMSAGQNTTVLISDGKKVINARIECQEKEVIKTKAGTFQTLRYEAFLFNGELYGRKGRMFIWISEDERRLPVQVRIQLPFIIGTVTLTLEKAERT